MSNKSKFYSALIIIIGLLLLSCQKQVNVTRIIQVIDGDTIIIEGGYHVRYIGIDAPEKNQPYFLEATRINKELVEGKKVRLEKDTSEKDRYGRLLRYIFVDDLFVNTELRRLGDARAPPSPPH